MVAADADFLARQLATMAPHRAILRAVECRLMSAVERQGPTLDIGCGDGHFASIAYDVSCDVSHGGRIDVGIDLQAAELIEASQRPNVYASVARADASALPFADGSFATVLSNCAVEHMPNLDAVIAEVARVLRPGGTFATTLPSELFADLLGGATLLRRCGLGRAGKAYGRFFNRISYHFHIHTPADWRERWSAAGFDVIDQHYYFSPQAHRAFDLCHYLGVPNLISRKLTGRWVLHPVLTRPFDRWLRRYYDEALRQPVGAYQFLVAVRRAG